jgi:hypothetical protein
MLNWPGSALRCPWLIGQAKKIFEGGEPGY